MTMHYLAYESFKIIMESTKCVINTDSYIVINDSLKNSILRYLLKPHYEWSFLPVESYFKASWLLTCNTEVLGDNFVNPDKFLEFIIVINAK